MAAYNAKHPYEPDWHQIPRGVWAKDEYTLVW